MAYCQIVPQEEPATTSDPMQTNNPEIKKAAPYLPAMKMKTKTLIFWLNENENENQTKPSRCPSSLLLQAFESYPLILPSLLNTKRL